ncbi:hypothetical protein LXL04_033313 [Taraxacum kok-saghyz]
MDQRNCNSWEFENTALGHPPISTNREDGLAEGGVTSWWWWLGDVEFVDNGKRKCAGGTESGDDDWGDGGRRLMLEEECWRYLRKRIQNQSRLCISEKD